MSKTKAATMMAAMRLHAANERTIAGKEPEHDFDVSLECNPGWLNMGAEALAIAGEQVDRATAADKARIAELEEQSEYWCQVHREQDDMRITLRQKHDANQARVRRLCELLSECVHGRRDGWTAGQASDWEQRVERELAPELKAAAIEKNEVSKKYNKTEMYENQVAVKIPKHLAEAIDKYLSTNWEDGRDPSKFGALNAVTFIGESMAALYANAKRSAKKRDDKQNQKGTNQ